eukprot:gene17657-36218_t
MIVMGKVLLLVVIWVRSSTLIVGEEDNCLVWAKNGECNSFPIFMWDFCSSVCAQSAKDDNDCKSLARSGSCTKEKNSVAVKCPESCGKPLLWNVWTRKSIGIEFSNKKSVDDSICTSKIQHSYNYAEVIRHRLVSFLSGYSIKEFNLKSEDEIMGMLGIGEAILYTAKIYNDILKQSKSTTNIAPKIITS